MPNRRDPRMTRALDKQQVVLLEILRRAAGAPVSYAQLHEAGIEFPASVVSELELAGVAIGRWHADTRGERRLMGVRLDASRNDPYRPLAASPKAVLKPGSTLAAHPERAKVHIARPWPSERLAQRAQDALAWATSALDSTALESYGLSGPGRYVTIYANAAHAFMYVAGLRLKPVFTRDPQHARRWVRSRHARQIWTRAEDLLRPRPLRAFIRRRARGAVLRTTACCSCEPETPCGPADQRTPCRQALRRRASAGLAQNGRTPRPTPRSR